MNASKNSNLMNSLLPLNSGSNYSRNNTSGSNSLSSTSVFSIGVILLIVAVGVTLMYYYNVEVTDSWNKTIDELKKAMGYGPAPPPPAPAPPPEAEAAPQPMPSDMPVHSNGNHTDHPGIVMNKIMPGSGQEVFNISSNKYTYNDAEPLCKALGAELATYDQVKDAWAKGADWCNYGWVKGQMAVYPTSDDSYQKIQSGPEDQRQSCGRPGLNGGYFDNPEMRFGVTCVGNKPAKNKHDEDKVAMGAPLSPDALAFDKKVSQFKSEADHIAILPFNNNKWTS